MTTRDEVSGRYPVLADFFSQAYFRNYGECVLDELEPLDTGVRIHGLGLAADLRHLLDNVHEDDDLEATFEALGQDEIWWIPGKTDREVVVRALGRVESWLTRDDVPDIDYHLDGVAPIPVRSRWLSTEDRERLLAELLRHHAKQIERWIRDPEGWPRLRVTMDSGREVGVVELRGPEQWSEVSHGVTHVVAILGRGASGAETLGCFPGLAPDPSWPTRYPEAAQVLGSFFSQAWPKIEKSVWESWIELVHTLGEPARRRCANQLAELLLLPEPEVQAAVHSLGSCVIPENTHAWLERLHWALSRWTPVRPPEPIVRRT